VFPPDFFFPSTNPQVAESVPDGRLALSAPGGCPEAAADVMRDCFKANPAERMRFSAICAALEAVTDDRRASRGAFSNPGYEKPPERAANVAKELNN